MFQPPPSYPDLVADADRAQFTGAQQTLLVPGVGCVAAYRPEPRSAAHLACAAASKTTLEQIRCLNSFVAEHIGDEEYDRLLDGLMESRLPVDAMSRVTKAVATWGTARPYRAVFTLCAHTGHHWRILRSRLLTNGVGDPMRLPSLHALLDFTESVILESMTSGNQMEDAVKRQQFTDSLYQPDPEELKTGTRPEGFSDEETWASFLAFEAAAQ
jgi:hypothetical protein